MVPTATTRPPWRRVWFTIAAAGGVELGPLGVQAVVLDPLGRDWPEGPQTDVECAIDAGNPPRGKAVEEVVGEMEPGRRRGHRPRHLGVEGLVAEPVAGALATLADVGGQGDLSMPLQKHCRGQRRAGRVQALARA